MKLTIIGQIIVFGYFFFQILKKVSPEKHSWILWKIIHVIFINEKTRQMACHQKYFLKKRRIYLHKNTRMRKINHLNLIINLKKMYWNLQYLAYWHYLAILWNTNLQEGTKQMIHKNWIKQRLRSMLSPKPESSNWSWGNLFIFTN